MTSNTGHTLTSGCLITQRFRPRTKPRPAWNPSCGAFPASTRVRTPPRNPGSCSSRSRRSWEAAGRASGIRRSRIAAAQLCTDPDSAARQRSHSRNHRTAVVAVKKEVPGAYVTLHQLQTNPVEFPVEVCIREVGCRSERRTGGHRDSSQPGRSRRKDLPGCSPVYTLYRTTGSRKLPR